ncbi:MAG: twitching motility protein PilT [Lachnospiraceae bacterium]|nr:twitching motility protein PilT [Lachnospiraceae bacterium]
MVQIIAGQKGKGKTTYLLERANLAVKESKGSIVYLDKSTKNMHSLNTEIRLVNVSDYPIRSYNAFIGFLCGIISKDYDLEYLFIDSFLKLAHLEDEDIASAVIELEQISQQYGITIVLSISLDASELPEVAQSKIAVSL